MKKKKDDKKKDDKEEKGIVESFLEGIPGFGNFFKALGRTEVFQKRFEEVNEQIEENLRKGEKKKWNVEGHISVRPLSMRPIVRELKKEIPESELEIGKDHIYGKKGNKLILGVKVPKKDVDLSIKGKTLCIKGDNFQKKLRLPDFYKNIIKKQYKKGILMLELTK